LTFEYSSPKAARRWLAEHFLRYRERKPWSFCWRVTLEYLVVAGLLASVAWLAGFRDTKLDCNRNTVIGYSLVVGPVVETLFQVVPVGIARMRKAPFASQVFWATLAFTVAHAMDGVAASAVIAGLVGGFYLAFTYAYWRERSRWTALWTTALSHAMANGVCIVAMIASGEI
jgi:hypothetical protein